ncbi:conserved Plasmodium protein, unknown function [Plasmodium berghei]|uniref:Uncharacterized protein n=2 Tax=Plasmodium berghei TaxID=5821 RepID=A0A509AIX2_PLABA|nr:conserved protein, unknown function [Plasmodium berghei ANKA]SCL92995.1 conserved Plasmodium protein, unknown function [Plasmodium berghei]SCM15768.1 conserved Plasmodium protein, unknown function [Plasmodium berghei]SCN23011.1 conserved Plasmodium protein, unknown function [Plasmodium berghei]VUC54545.1 conserved protein, unknown function [Plasmodium berghei ANKA]|eukprot:XP_034420374.1 conserved protein, unknown function [Plasmodium berghei ANKA]
MLYFRINQNTQWTISFNYIFKKSKNGDHKIIYKQFCSTVQNINDKTKVDKIESEANDIKQKKREHIFPDFGKSCNILDPISKSDKNKIDKIIKNIKINIEKHDILKNQDCGNDILTSEIYKKIVQEHKLYKKNKDNDKKTEIKNNFYSYKKSKERKENEIISEQNVCFESRNDFEKNIENDEIPIEQEYKDVEHNNSLPQFGCNNNENILEKKIHAKKNTSLLILGGKASSSNSNKNEHKYNNSNKNIDIVEYTKDKNINNILLYSKKKNNLTIHEKKKDHFFKIFFSSKKVKIIKSQNHPIFIHLYKLATNQRYREKQEKILLTNKKIIMERQQNHITRIYTNSIDNLKDFISYDNFILLSNKLLKKLAFLYSFKNGILAEIMHKFYYDDVGLPYLAFCFYNINCTGNEKKNTHKHMFSNVEIKQEGNSSFCESEQNNKIYDDNFLQKENKIKIDNDTHVQSYQSKINNLINDKHSKDSHLYLDKNSYYEDIEYLCNGDIGTIIRSCFLLKWQCIFNINDIKIVNSKKKKKQIENEKMGEITGNEIKKCISDKYSNMYNIYNIDFFHPFTIRASSGYLLDIPYKNTSLYEIHQYAKQRKILLLKYNSQSNLYINYKKKNSEQDITFLNLISKAKGVFLIMDNCNNIEKMYTSSVSKTGINISRSYFEESEINGEPFKENSYNNAPENNDDNIFDNIYYINLLNNNNVDKPLELVPAYTIFMYILKTNFFKHVPQSSYVCMQ